MELYENAGNSVRNSAEGDWAEERRTQVGGRPENTPEQGFSVGDNEEERNRV